MPRRPRLRRRARAEAGGSDEALLATIRADLARSPWTGEGHRKVWATVQDGKVWLFGVIEHWNAELGHQKGRCR